MAFDIYAMVTDRIIAELEKGNIPWHKPWVSLSECAYSRNRVKGKKGEKKAIPYSLLNQLLLGKPGEWATMNVWEEAGCAVKPDEKGSPVVFWSFIPKKDEKGKIILDKDDKPVQQPFLRYYTVFHIDQVEKCEFMEVERKKKDGTKYTAKIPVGRTGIRPEPVIPETPLPCGAERIDNAEKLVHEYVNREGIYFHNERGSGAYYAPTTDEVVLPIMDQFADTAEYYSAAFHELTHSTGHAKRLNRLEKGGFGSSSYSKEELVAELGSAMVMNTLGIHTDGSMRNSAAYIQAWLKALQDDKRMIVSASGKAEKAVRYMMNLQEKNKEAEANVE